MIWCGFVELDKIDLCTVLFRIRENIYPVGWIQRRLEEYHDRALLKELVIEEKGRVSRTSISNWAGQLYTFCQEMKIGDYVLIPSNSSHQFTFARIAGDYEYNPQNKEGLWHSRDIGIIVDYIPSSIFSKSVRYSLGAYRTIFKAKDEEEILTEINKYIARKDL